MLTNERREQIRQRCEAATPGPWHKQPIGHSDHIYVYGGFTPISKGYAPRPDDVEFIAHAREDIPALLAEVDRLRFCYHSLLIDHLRVMRNDSGLYDAGTSKTGADLLRQMADQGLFIITVNGPENRVMGRLTPEGEKVLGGEE